MKNPIWMTGPLAALALSACGGGGGGTTMPTSNNAAPTISGLAASESVLQDASSNPIAFEIGDAETGVDALNVSIASSNEALLPVAGIQLNGNGSSRTLILVPEAGQSGSAQVSVSVKDADGSITTKQLMVEVTGEERSFHDFALASIDASPDAQPAEVAGTTWIETDENDPTAFDPVLNPVAD